MKLKLLIFIVFLCLFLVSIIFASSSDTVTVSLNATTVWWSDPVNISGTATYSNGTAMSDGTVSVTISNKQYCLTNCLANGDYSCVFRAPTELGTYTVTVTVTNTTGSTVTNTTTLTVKPSYGALPSGKTSRVVYEVPMILQEPSGRIRRVWVRVISWRG